jgi:hypothetical protein
LIILPLLGCTEKELQDLHDQPKEFVMYSLDLCDD